MDSEKTVALVAPAKLKNAFTVLLNSVPDLKLLVYAADYEGLFLSLQKESPDVVLAYVGERTKEGWIICEQTGQIKALWPEAYFIALIKNVKLQAPVQETGADAVFFEGVSPTRLVSIMETLDS